MTVYAKISELPAGTTLSGAEQIETSQAGVSARLTPAQIAEFCRRTLTPIIFRPGNPDFSAPQGTLYSRTDAASSTERLWVNANGGTSWAFFTASA